MIEYLSISYLSVIFWITSIINGFFTLYHIKYGKVPSRLLLAMAFAFLGLASWFDAIAVSIPVDQIYAVSWLIYFSRVLVFMNIVTFSGSMMHLFKEKLSNVDILFLVMPVIAIIIAMLFSPYEFRYYDYGWGISNYELSALVMGPFGLATILYVIKMTYPYIQTMKSRKMRRNMRILLYGWCFAFVLWGIIVGVKIFSGLPDISTFAISIVLMISQYPFMTEKTNEKEE